MTPVQNKDSNFLEEILFTLYDTNYKPRVSFSERRETVVSDEVNLNQSEHCQFLLVN